MHIVLTVLFFSLFALPATAAELRTKTEIDVLNPTATETGRYGQVKPDTTAGQALVIVTRPESFNIRYAAAVDQDGLQIGARRTAGGVVDPHSGWVDEVRSTKDVGRYGGPFTVPSGIFPRSGSPAEAPAAQVPSRRSALGLGLGSLDLG